MAVTTSTNCFNFLAAELPASNVVMRVLDKKDDEDEVFSH
jgi:hypothetical protein